MSTSKELGDVLLSRGLLKPEWLQVSRMEQRVTKESLGRVLVRNGFIRQDALFKVIREINPNALHDEAIYQAIIPGSVLKETRSMVTALVDDTVYVSTMTHPDYVRRRVAPYIGDYKLAFTPVNPVRVLDYLRHIEASAASDKEFNWEKVFTKAMMLKASDIHIIPKGTCYFIFYRRDGEMEAERAGHNDEYIALTSRLKDLARMDMAERRRPQDGGFSLEYNGRVVNFRVVTVPTKYGERMVIRILDPDAVHLSLDQLGISRLAEWRAAVAKSDGLCLICGPTGSGKTTTLAATVREMNFLHRAVYTAEDPVENDIPFAGQVNINDALGLTFSNATRTFMRADPDVMILGEVRDLDTALNALKGAETGHLLIATLHTGSVMQSLTRLEHLGVKPYEILHLLRGVMVQRLIRTFCKDCKGSGCDLCNHTGYRGREAVTEVAAFRNEHDVQAALDGKVTWPTILQDAKQKVLAGRTSPEELYKEFGVRMEDIE